MTQTMYCLKQHKAPCELVNNNCQKRRTTDDSDDGQMVILSEKVGKTSKEREASKANFCPFSSLPERT
jgi:hypothetical protein